MGILSGIISMFSWGGADFCAALSSRKIGNILTFFWMQVIGLMAFLIYFFLNFPSLNIQNLVAYLPILFAVAFLQLIAYMAFYKGLEKYQVSLVSPIGGAYGLVVALLSIIFYGETLKGNQIFAIFIIVLSVMLVSVDLKTLFKAKKLTVFGGVKEGLIAMFGWGISLFLIVIPSKALGWFLPVFVFKILVLTLLTFFLFFTKKSFKPNASINNWMLLILIGLLDMTAFFAYSFGVNGYYASIVASASTAFPLITVALAKVVLKEKMSPNQIIGVLGIISGLVLITI